MNKLFNNFLSKYLFAIIVIVFFIPKITLSQSTYVPDDNFENYLEANGMGDGIALNDYVLTSNINTVNSLSISSLSISDLTGIEDFAALSLLDAQGNGSLSSVNLSQNSLLSDARFNSCNLGSLDLSNNPQLTILTCGGNNLSALDVSNNPLLTTLDCWSNSIVSLDLSQNTALTTINCNSNQLLSLDFSNNPNITSVSCNSNQITTLDVTSLASLQILWCPGNQISSLDLSQNTQLNTIRCENNQLYRLNVKNGNNINVTQFYTTGNPSLECINVDDSTYSANNWTNIDSQQYFGESCFCSIVINSQTNVSCYGGFDASLQVSGYGGNGVYSYTFGVYNAFFDTIFQLGQSNGFYIQPWNIYYLPANCYTFTINDSTGTCGDTSLICITEPDEIVSTSNQTVCDEFLFNGNVYSTSGSYSAVLTANNGCDSTVTLNLTVNSSDTSIQNITACDNYLWFGNTYTSSGTFDTIFTNSSGCDSVYILNLIINNSSTNTINIDACNSYDWQGLTYSTSGQYVSFFSATNGCDSTVTLNLTITYSDTSFLNVASCDSFTLNNITYNQSGLYYQTISADSLTGFNYVGTYNGSTYYISENPEYWLVAQSNCIASGGNLVCISDANENDFVSNILPAQQFWLGYTDETIEGSFVWVDGSNHTYTKWSPTEPSNSGPTGNEDYTLINSGEGGSNPLDGFWNDIDDNLSQYLYVLELPYSHLTSNGCDSVIALDLTINVSDTSYTNITACDSLEWNGVVYDSSGTYYSVSNNLSSNSLIFDGSGYVSISDNPSLNWGFNNFSVSVWVNKNNSSPWLQTIITKMESTSGNYVGWNLGLVYNQIRFTPGVGTVNGTWVNNGTINSNFTLNDNQWYYITGVFDGTNSQTHLYVDGILIASETANYTINPNNSQDLKIGVAYVNGAPSGPEFFYGNIDNVEIWNRALDISEIQNYMTCSPIGSEQNLLGYWNFEEGSGSTAFDKTSSGNDGTINGAVFDSNVSAQSCQLINSNSCDSVAVLNLTIYNATLTTDSITICEGSNITVGTNTYDTSGVYVDTLQSINGCDSIINTILELINVDINQNDTAICLGDSIVLSVNSSFSNYSDTNTQSLQFNYGQYATIPNNGSLLNDTTYTIEFWYKESAFSGGDEHIFGNDWFSSKIYFSRGGVGGGDVNFLRGNNLSTNNIQNQWNHYAGVRDGNTVYFFIDGVLVDSEPYNNSISTSLVDFTVNHHTWNSGSSARLSGFFDELRISNVARYTSSFTPPNYEFITDSNTLYLLHFNGNILDEMNNDGTLNGANFSSDVPFSSFTQITANNNTYLWSTGDTTSSITVAPTQTTTYFVTQIQNGISCTDSITITVNNPLTSTIIDSSCNSYDWDGVTYTSSGQYVNVYTGSNGCDSIVTLNLTINVSDTSYNNITACDSVEWNGIWYDSSGTYSYSGGQQISFSGFSYSGSLANSDYYVSNNSASWEEADSICNALGGHLVVISDVNENNFIDNLTNHSIWIGLRQNPNNINFSEPAGGWEWVNNESFNYSNWAPIEPNNAGGFENHAEMSGSGLWNDNQNLNSMRFLLEIPSNLQTVNGCDSVAILNLIINQSDTSYTNITACDSVEWNGEWYNSSGTYYYSGNNLDSNITGFSYFGYYNGRNYYISNTPEIRQNAKNICSNYGANLVCIGDSIENAFIQNNFINWSLNGNSILIGLDYISNNNWIWDNGEITNYFNWGPGEPSDTPNVAYVEMYNSGLWYDGSNISITHYYLMEVSATLSNINGCDSVAVLNLTINNSSVDTVTISACDSFIWNGVTYDSTGHYTNIYSGINGCDSTVTIDLIINYSSFNSLPVSSCDSYDWDGVTYTTTGLYTNIYTDINGCDSSVTLDLTIYNSSLSSFSITACDFYDWYGVTYSTTGLYTNIYTDINGCDSSVTLDLTINNSYTSTLTLTVCDSFIWDSVIYTTSGIYTNIYTGYNGCDSSVTFDLTVNYSESSTEIISICDSSYSWGGITYSSEGIYSNVLVFANSNGCDSIVTLNLTIGYSDTTNFSINICDATYTWDGITYDSTGIYTNIYTNTFGCDSIVFLNLSINYSSTDTITLSSCDSYFWDGVTYSTSGFYTNVYTNSNSCDSTVVLNLIINNSSFDTITVNSCDSFYWDSITYNLSGIYTNLYIDQFGCDSSVTLDLFLNYSSFDTLTISSCDTYTWDGITYDTSGLYTNVYVDANGCDSVVSLSLTILYSYSSTVIVSNCDSYDWDGITYTSTGLYTNIYNAVNGCDSTVVLDLTIISSPNIIQNDSSICYGDSITLSVDLSTQMNSSANICLLSELSTNLQNNLIAFYPLCGNPDDISLNSNNGIVNGAVLSENRFGDSLSAYSFNGTSDYIELSNSSSLSSLDSNLSLSFWIYPNNNNDGTIIDRDICGNNADWHLSWRANGSSARILLRVDNQYLYSGNYNPNQWLHIAAIKNNSNFELYINNQFQGSISAPINFTNTSLPIYIGDQVCNSSTEPNFNGKIDDVGIWSRALNMNEVSQLYSSSFPNYVWSTGDTSSTITVSPNTNTSFWVEKIENGISCYDSITISVLDTSSSYTQHTECGSYIFNGITYSSTGLYSYNTTNYLGCDSIAYLDLIIQNTYSFTDSVGICPGDSVFVGTSIYSNIGTYIDSFQTTLGCDSVIITEIYNSLFGCTDPTAYNYDSLALCDDNSCIMPVYGCLDSTALNYYAGANFDDGSCIYVGCTDSTATNYNSSASIDDGSCVYTFCLNPSPNGLYTTDITDEKVRINWNNMNDSSCKVWKYFVRYRQLGTSSWTTKSAGVGSGLCNIGLNTQSKLLQNLIPSTTYEFKMKAFYCGGTESSYSSPVQFTTDDLCPEITNFTTQTFYVNPNKVRFSWDTTGLYVFARIVLRIDSIGSSWQTAGGYGIYYPNQSVNKYGLQPGQFYRAQARSFCDSNITSYKSWWTPPIFWQQPSPSRINGGSTISNLEVFPNPSRDIFNVTFVSKEKQFLQIRILNIIGEQIYLEEREEFIGEYTKRVNLDNYGKGVYFLEVETKSGVINKKLILQ